MSYKFAATCHKYILTIGLRSVYETEIQKIGLFNADLAALSAFSLPEKTTGLGNQQNITLKELYSIF